MVRVFSKFEPIPSTYIEVDTTSTGSFKDLSPFYLGPITYNCPFTGPQKCLRFENLWQYCKVYPQHAHLPNRFGKSGLPQDYKPTEEYFAWRNAGFAKGRAVRYPMGKKAKPLYSLWGVAHYNYVDARRVIYIPHYAELVTSTTSYAMLYNWVLQGRDIALLDYDGYDHVSRNMTLRDVIHNTTRSMGHSFIIYGLLTGGLSESLD